MNKTRRTTSRALRAFGLKFLLSGAVLLATSPMLFLLAPAAAQAPPSQASPAQAQALLAQADEVLEEMSQITGLPIKGPLKKLVLSRAEIRKYLEGSLREEYTPEEIHTQEAELKAFGLVSAEFDLAKFLIAFYTEQAAGAYDAHRKTMFIADWPPPEMQRLVLAHELTHALQDQNFDLLKFLHGAKEDDDATNARQAVMEGHATAAMMQSLIGETDLGALPSLQPMMAGVINQQFTEFPAFSNAPYFFRLEALFPYVQGMGFIQTGLQHGGWKELKTLFVKPPASTKEIFEPDVYFESKPLPKIALPRPFALNGRTDLHTLSENIFGELGYYALLGQFISENEAKTVASGWLADRFILYEAKVLNRFALISRTRWASAETALAFFRDYHTILAHKYPELSPDKRSGTDLFIGSTANGQAILLRKGDECLWAEGVPLDKADAMLKWLESL